MSLAYLILVLLARFCLLKNLAHLKTRRLFVVCAANGLCNEKLSLFLWRRKLLEATKRLFQKNS